MLVEVMVCAILSSYCLSYLCTVLVRLQVCAPHPHLSHTHGNIHLSLAVLHHHVCHALLLHPSQRLQSCSALPISMSTIASSSLNPARLYTSLYSASSGTHPSRSAVSTKCIKCFEVVQRIHYVRRTSLQSHPHTSPPTPHSHIRSFGTLGQLLKIPPFVRTNIAR